MKYAVVDLEMCKVPKSLRGANYKYCQETIQIGAVLLDENYEIVDKFNTYVNPEFGRIDTYIKRLTGILVENIIDAPKMEEALEMFSNWLPKSDVCCVAWSESDDAQIRHEMEAKGIENHRISELLETWIDCQKTFDDRMETNRNFSLEEAIIAADIPSEGRAHDGFYDAYNTALLFAKMQRNPNFELHPAYKAAHEGHVEHLGITLGDMFGGLLLQCSAS